MQSMSTDSTSATLSENSAEQLHAAFTRLRAARDANTPTYQERIAALKRLRAAFQPRLEEMARALDADFGGRPREVSLLSDGMVVLNEIDYAVKHLRRWMRAKKVPVNTIFLPARGEVRAQPIGVVGIIAPWNYPVQLVLAPLVSALAAGCRAMLKPSEFTPNTNVFLQRVLREAFGDTKDWVVMVEGDHTVSAEFSSLPFDHLFFTGSTTVGKLVMAAAAKNLTPVTLELGGKSPVIIAPDYPIEVAAQRIALGKNFNSGQTCIAPDYVLLPKSRIEAFVAAMKAWMQAAHPDAANDKNYTHVINARQHERLQAWLAEAKSKGAQIEVLSSANTETRAMPLTLVIDAPADCKLRQEEIFGPILLLESCESVEEACVRIKSRPRPLAFYLFDHQTARTEKILDDIVCGGVTVNDTLLHFVQKHFPAGGVGPAGMGAYHGETGFNTFTKFTGVMYQAKLNGTGLFTPPYSNLVQKMLGWMTR